VAWEPNHFDKERPVSRVRIGRGFTQNMGNFQSVRLDEAIEVPCNTSLIEIAACREWLIKEVESSLHAAIGKLPPPAPSR
jgi:hypothetical protein